tara:strand:+ start:2624 stop:3118 length:495 start_codon:yes stop_codon:yes gene_type:complete
VFKAIKNIFLTLFVFGLLIAIFVQPEEGSTDNIYSDDGYVSADCTEFQFSEDLKALLQEDISTAGAEPIEVYGVLFFLIIIAFVSLIKRNFTTVLISSILGVFSLLAIPFLFFVLMFNLFGPDKHLGVGLLIAFMVIGIYAVTEFKKRKRNPKVISDDLLDTDF